MDIQHKSTDSKGSFFIIKNEEKVAKMTYSKAGNDKIIIDHTEVADELRGKGAGVQLVEAAVEFARENDITILPLCPFAKSIFQKREELRDVL